MFSGKFIKLPFFYNIISENENYIEDLKPNYTSYDIFSFKTKMVHAIDPEDSLVFKSIENENIMVLTFGIYRNNDFIDIDKNLFKKLKEEKNIALNTNINKGLYYSISRCK